MTRRPATWKVVTFGAALNHGVIAVGKVGQPTDRNHHVKHRHFLLVRQELRAGGLAKHPDLLAVGTHEAGDHHGHDRIAHELAKRFFHIARNLGRGFALGHQLVNQWGGHLAIGAHRHRGGQLGVAPDGDVQHVAWAHDVAVVGR